MLGFNAWNKLGEELLWIRVLCDTTASGAIPGELQKLRSVVALHPANKSFDSFHIILPVHSPKPV